MDIPTILQQRDRQSFDWLYDQYAGSLLTIIRRMVKENDDCEKVLVETYVAVWNSLEEFEGENNKLFVRMLQIARAKVAEIEKPDGSVRDDAITNNNKVWTPSLQKRATQGGTLISREKQAK